MNTTTADAPQVARWNELKPASKAFLDSYIPEFQKENFRVIGQGVTEDPSSQPAIKGRHGFSVGYARMEPGKGAALHSHRTLEVFIPLNGPMTVVYGPDGEHEITLNPWDVASVPIGVMRGFRNPNDFPLVIMALIQESSTPERVEWHEDVKDQAASAGAKLDEQGNLNVTAQV